MDLEFNTWQEVTNEDLEKMIAAGLSEERAIVVAMLSQLNIVFRRGLYAMRGYTSLNEYLTEQFGMSKQQAFMRAAVARVIHEHPGLLDMLERGETHLSHLATIAPRLTPANSPILYNAAATMTKRELEAFVPKVACDGSILPGMNTINLSIRCHPDCADLLDEVRALVGVNDGTVNQGEALRRALAFYIEKNHPEQKAQRAQKRAEKRALAAEKILEKLQEGWDEERGHPQALAVAKYNREMSETQAADLPGKPEVTAAGDALVGNGQAADLPGKPEVTAAGDALVGNEAPAYRRLPIAAAVKHQVWLRDGGRCTFVSADGRRCQARHYLQADHITMICQGGSNDESNLRLLCATHNRLNASLQAESRYVDGESS